MSANVIDLIAEKLNVDVANVPLLISGVLGLGAFLFILLVGTSWGDGVSSKGKKIREQRAKQAKRDLSTKYTRAEVAKHNKEDDCWILLKHRESQQWRVYEITEYVDLHPGGPAILRNAGGDATVGFYGVQHAGRALEMIEDYQIGILADP